MTGVVVAAVAGVAAALLVTWLLGVLRRWPWRRRWRTPPPDVIHGLGAMLYFARRTHDHRPDHVCPVPGCYWPVA